MLDLNKHSQSQYIREDGEKKSLVTSSESIWKNLSHAIAMGDIDTAIQAHDAMPRENYIWHLSGANDIVEALVQKPECLDNNALHEAQARIVQDATNLAVSRLEPEDIGNLGLSPRYFDDAGIDRPPELKDALLLGRSWDNTDRHPLVGELFARIVEHLESHGVEEIAHAFQTSLEDETLTFHTACLRAYARYNDFSMKQSQEMTSPSIYTNEIATNEDLKPYGVRRPSVEEVVEGAKLT